MSHYLGQCFLKDQKYRDDIIQKIKKEKKEKGFQVCIEIGPGKGALSKDIVDIFDKVYFFEKDESFSMDLNGLLDDIEGEIFWGDVLEYNIGKILNEKGIDMSEVLVVGNLPYYITSPILKKFFANDELSFGCGIFMVQKQVGDKIKYRGKKRSFLWWLLNYQNKVFFQQKVPAGAFDPVPKVDSCLVTIKQRNKYGFQGVDMNGGYDKLISFLDTANTYSRKMLRKIWKIVNKKNDDEKNGVMEINGYKYVLPQDLRKKRLEKVSRSDIESIFSID